MQGKLARFPHACQNLEIDDNLLTDSILWALKLCQQKFGLHDPLTKHVVREICVLCDSRGQFDEVEEILSQIFRHNEIANDGG